MTPKLEDIIRSFYFSGDEYLKQLADKTKIDASMYGKEYALETLTKQITGK